MGLTTGRPWKINGVYPTKPCLVCNTLIDVKERARWDRTKFCSKACKYAYKKPVITILETDTLKCSQCKKMKLSRDFYKDQSRKGVRAGFCYKCKACANEAGKQYVRSYMDSRKKHLLAKYGLSIEQYMDMHESQNGLCAICLQPETALDRMGNLRPLAVDHNHDTGAVRGLLCHGCNVGIGLLKDDVDIIISAALYLNKSVEIPSHIVVDEPSFV